MLRFLIEKEFKHIIRHPFIPKIIFAFPCMVMLVFPWAASFEVKDVNLSVVDSDHSTFSTRLVQKIVSSGYFRLTDVSDTYLQALESIESHTSDIILTIANGFERDLVREDFARVNIAANAVNGTRGGVGTSYLSAIIRDFSNDLRIEQGGNTITEQQISNQISQISIPMIEIVPQYRFNPQLDYKVFIVPALMVILLTLLTGFLPALNVVGEKETGTIEQMNVTPVGKFQFILAKLIPYWLIGFIALSISFGLAALIYRLFPAGSLLTVYCFASIFVLVVSGFGLVVSNYSATMQQAMFVMMFFVIVFILMSGLFTPVRSMPEWAQVIAAVNPLKYFIEIMRMVYLKGSALSDLKLHLCALAGFAVFFNLWAVFSYRKTS